MTSFLSIPRAALCATAVAAGLGACGGSGGHAPEPLQLRVLGSRADLVTDGDARAEIVVPSGADAASLKVMANGRDVTSAFSGSGGKLTGVVTGLAAGTNTLVVSAGGVDSARLDLKNTSRGGPIISGPQPTPFHCATVTARTESGTTPATLASGLGTEAVDAQCNIATEFKFFYRTTAAPCSLANPDPNPPATAPATACFKPYTPGTTPADLATTTTDSGQSVPYIVRVERGTMNRAIYDMAVLADPAKPATAQPTWNGKALFVFGGGGGQPRRQSRPASNWTDDDALARGWMVTVSSFTDGSLNNNRVLGAETVMMLKEHIVDSYGPIRFTVGKGSSGGSITNYTIASTNPGVLDGVLIWNSLLDYDTSHGENWECSQLVEAFDGTPWKNLMATAAYSQEQVNAKRAAIAGHRDHTACIAWYNSFGQQRFVGNTAATRTVPAANRDSGGAIVVTQLPTPTNGCQLPASVVYDPLTNPGGVRCGPWDWMAGIYGKTDGGGNSTRDNTGIQYGLKALQSGAITAEEFVVLNEHVGGIARDGMIGPARAVADQPALDVAYKTGLITGRNMGSIAIIDMRGWDDSQIAPPNGVAGSGLHQYWRSYGVRARLDQANGHHDNHVMWRFARTGTTPSATMFREALLEMDKWLTALKADGSGTALLQKIVRAKPASTFDYCLLSTDAAQSTKVRDPATCDADPLLKPWSSPRQVAGGPLAENVLKCQLKPVSAADYAPAVLTAAQLARLQAAFPGGVCDWSKPGVSQVATGDVPYTFMGGPGGQPLGAAPVQRNP